MERAALLCNTTNHRDGSVTTLTFPKVINLAQPKYELALATEQTMSTSSQVKTCTLKLRMHYCGLKLMHSFSETNFDRATGNKILKEDLLVLVLPTPKVTNIAFIA